MTRRVGMFGGAFDPPHIAHVALARAAVEQLALDELRVIPTGQPPHKTRALTPAEDRWAMACIAFGDIPKVLLDRRELDRGGASYTIDTLHELMREQPGAEFFLVMGEDQARVLTSWRDWREIIQIATISIAARSGAAGDNALPVLQLPVGARTAPLQLPQMPESATEVRRRLAAHEGVTPLVPHGVARYIDQHHLYQPH